MVRLADGLKICLFVLAEYMNVTDGQKDGRTLRLCKASHDKNSVLPTAVVM